MEPKAVKPRKGEVESIIKEKKITTIQDRLQRQRNYRYVVRDMLVKRFELNEMAEQITTDNITIQWEGTICPKSLLIAKYNLKKVNYNNLQMSAKYLQQALVNDGLTEKDISKVIDGDYVKDNAKLDKLDK